MDSDGLRQTIEALAEMKADNYRVLITKAPPPPQAEAINLRNALEKAGIPTFSASIPLLKAFEKAAAAGVIVSAVDDPRAARAWEAYVSTGKEVIAYGNSH
jgi:chromosome partitioning protein